MLDFMELGKKVNIDEEAIPVAEGLVAIKTKDKAC